MSFGFLDNPEREYLRRFQELKKFAREHAPLKYPALLEIENNYVACALNKISRKQYCSNLKGILRRYKVDSRFIDSFEKTWIVEPKKDRVAIKMRNVGFPANKVVARKRKGLLGLFNGGGL